MAVDPEIEARLDWLERAVFLLGESVPGVKLPPRPGAEAAKGAPSPGFAGSMDANAEQEIRALIQAGRTVSAVKAYQEANGVGLKEAKREIDRLSEELGRG
jgi:ribosomal protein L7/L12